MSKWHTLTISPILKNIGHFTVFAVRRFYNERMSSAAASLTYSTLLALVPMLVIAFAILSSFPAFDAVKERMQALFFAAVVPEAGAAITEYLSNFTQSANNLTAVGVVALAVTALLLLSTIEDTLNRIWHVERPRPIFVRFLIFWAILTMGPLVFGASFTLTSDIAAIARRSGFFDLGGAVDEVLLEGWSTLSNLLSLAIKICGFTALFVLVPARRVRLRHAAIGATFAAVALEILSWGFNSFLTSGSSYETIYGAVAAVPVFLVWIYASWTVIILGAVVAAAIPDWRLARAAVLSVHLKAPGKLTIAIALLAKLYQQAQIGGAVAEEELVETIPIEARDEIYNILQASGYVLQTEDSSVVLARDLHTTTVFELATEMELALGIATDHKAETGLEAIDGLDEETAAIHRLLTELSDAESRILGCPIVDVIANRCDETRMTGKDATARVRSA
ncbi:YihY family inner membrane protein [Hoeflea ulvae]|uniref:UPF0761 membrane protein OEG82_03540 n=1 Tax=Hoeflea ulvae TaxID=2983764 RepID=A0ABT3YB56_9HYPH|nr:YihY family inner membrane protein [Hoeflea ulvae]MCY0093111.1 YihY family inner membrane protein [Hoeflea ulvae]